SLFITVLHKSTPKVFCLTFGVQFIIDTASVCCVEVASRKSYLPEKITSRKSHVQGKATSRRELTPE
ncbi:MAG: hypothetical protein K2H21_01740, partial [Muribaculaceae bacterium]|nr:hypothetical protein [Muribaculaceae bacterium]